MGTAWKKGVWRCRRFGPPSLAHDLPGLLRRVGDGLVHALLAGHGGAQFKADGLDHFLRAGAGSQRRSVFADFFAGGVVLLAESLFMHPRIVHDAVAHGGSARDDALCVLSRRSEPMDEGPRGVLVVRVRRNG